MAYEEVITVTMHAIAKIGPEYLRIVNKTLIDCDVLSSVHTKHLMKTLPFTSLLCWINTTRVTLSFLKEVTDI